MICTSLSHPWRRIKSKFAIGDDAHKEMCCCNTPIGLDPLKTSMQIPIATLSQYNQESKLCSET